MERIKNQLICSQEEAREIIWGDNENFDIVYKKIIDTSRWSHHYECVVQHNNDGSFWMTYYSVGATEQQDEAPFEYTDPVFELVRPVEVRTIEYKLVKD